MRIRYAPRSRVAAGLTLVVVTCMYVWLLQAEDTETAGGRYLPATCVMLDWLRLTAAGPNAGYLALRDDDAQQALWTGVARLLNALPADPHVRTTVIFNPRHHAVVDLQCSPQRRFYGNAPLTCPQP